MSDAAVIQLCNAVADTITAAGVISGAPAGSPGTAVVAFVPEYELAELEDAKVTVVPAAEDRQLHGRKAYEVGYAVDVAVHSRSGENADTAALIGAVEQLADLLASSEIDIGGQRVGRPTRVRIDPLFSPELLREKRTFLSVIRAVYPAVRPTT